MSEPICKVIILFNLTCVYFVNESKSFKKSYSLSSWSFEMTYFATEKFIYFIETKLFLISSVLSQKVEPE